MKKLIKLIISLLFLSLLSACGENNNQETANKTTLKIPTPLQKLVVGQGELSAYVLLDGSSTKIPMVINNDAGGTASVVLPGLTRSIHNITITYEYTDDNGSFILAQITQEANLTAGSLNLNIDAGGYSLAFDEDFDGITNTDELLAGSDPRIAIGNAVERLRISANIPKLNAVANSGGTFRVFVTLDGNLNNEINMDIDLTNATANKQLNNLTPELHTILITFEYTDASKTYILATMERTVDLTRGGDPINISVTDFDFTAYDNDGDGTYNIDEIINNLNPSAENLPLAANVKINYQGVKTFRFTWDDVGGDAITYQLLENKDGNSGFSPVVVDIPAKIQFFEHVVTLYARQNAQYIFRSCNALGCTNSEQMNVTGNLAGSVGFFESSILVTSSDGHTLAMKDDSIGSDNNVIIFTDETGIWQEQARIPSPYIITGGGVRARLLKLNADGTTLAMTLNDNRIGSGINSTETATIGRSTDSFGSVYVYIRIGDNWVQQAYIKASNPDLFDLFGSSMSLSDDGNALAVGALFESSDAKGTAQTIDQLNNNLLRSGAVYMFARNSLGEWRQQAYIKASNPDEDDRFSSLSLSGDGSTLAVGAMAEDSSLTGITSGDGLQLPVNNNARSSGAVYVFTLNQQLDTWSQEAYIKANNADLSDFFGGELSLSSDGNTLAVGAIGEESSNRDNPADNSFTQTGSNSINKAGAVYIFERNISGWVQIDYLKPEVIYPLLSFGSSMSFSGDGKILAIGASSERRNTVGLGGLQGDDGSPKGAAYLFSREIDSWVQQNYIKASKNDTGFGRSIKLSNDGTTLAVSASSGLYLY